MDTEDLRRELTREGARRTRAGREREQRSGVERSGAERTGAAGEREERSESERSASSRARVIRRISGERSREGNNPGVNKALRKLQQEFEDLRDGTSSIQKFD